MSKTIICLALSAMLFALSLLAQAQQSAMPVVGWLNHQPLATSRNTLRVSARASERRGSSREKT